MFNWLRRRFAVPLLVALAVSTGAPLAAQSATQPAGQPAGGPGTQPASQPAGQPAGHPAGHSGTQPAVSSSTEAVVAHLERTRALFLASIAGLTPEQWAWKASPDRWSVGECAEHITRAEPFLRDFAVKTTATPTAPELLAKSHGKSAQVLAMITDRSAKFQAPDAANPAKEGTTRALAAIERDFNFERGRTHELTAAHADLESHASVNMAFQELDLAGWIYFLSGHTERHTKQIDEVKATAGFPAR